MEGTNLSQPACMFSDLLKKVKPDNIQENINTLHKPTSTSSKPQPKIRRYTKLEIRQLKEMVEQGKTIKQIARKLERSPSSIRVKLKALGVTTSPKVPQDKVEYIARHYALYGAKAIADKLRISVDKVRRVAGSLGLSYKSRNAYNPPLPRSPLPYEMTQRVAFLQRDNPLSKDKVDDCVMLLYNTQGPSTPMIAIHMNDLMMAVEDHFERRRGVVSSACMFGWRRKQNISDSMLEKNDE
ncbi:helix-turn-helix domain-containing protein [Thaumasiovibrio subtropicus]|uniref:helix-turn-helix domain-containing protein n=1 Tax=Thaumasiovibrio subtropicus TaxID=1891207 RepID=UPI000B35A58D|nr:response regulator transcription factor [Thaumasiovibrio subtropicus]